MNYQISMEFSNYTLKELNFAANKFLKKIQIDLSTSIKQFVFYSWIYFSQFLFERLINFAILRIFYKFGKCFKNSYYHSRYVFEMFIREILFSRNLVSFVIFWSCVTNTKKMRKSKSIIPREISFSRSVFKLFIHEI